LFNLLSLVVYLFMMMNKAVYWLIAEETKKNLIII
jgi:hypothetical protein